MRDISHLKENVKVKEHYHTIQYCQEKKQLRFSKKDLLGMLKTNGTSLK